VIFEFSTDLNFTEHPQLLSLLGKLPTLLAHCHNNFVNFHHFVETFVDSKLTL